MDRARIGRIVGRQLQRVKGLPVVGRMWRELLREALRDSLRASNALSRMTAQAAPRTCHETQVSVLIDLTDRSDATHRCLATMINAAHRQPVEVIAAISDGDPAIELRSYFPDLRLVEVGPSSVVERRNRLAASAAGAYLVFVRHDLEVAIDFVDQLVRLAADPRSACVVGGMVIDAQGRVLEAGLTRSQDGRLQRCGVGVDPAAAEWQTDHACDGFIDGPIGIRRSDFEALGGFEVDTDELHVADLCLRAAEAGRAIRYDPALAAVDWSLVGNAALSSQPDARIVSTYGALHADRIAALAARNQATTRPDRRQRILVMEDRVPHAKLGKGYPRTKQLITTLDALGYEVTLYPMRGPNDLPVTTYRTLPRTVRVLHHDNVADLAQTVRHDLDEYDLVIVSRPYNMRVLRKALAMVDMSLAQLRPRIVYDAEAIFAFREIAALREGGKPVSESDASRRVDEEMRLTDGCTAVISVSDAEADCFRAGGVARVFTLGHAIEIRESPADFTKRRGLLFVGALVDPGSPNVDGLGWFLEEVMPLLAKQVPPESYALLVAGGLCEEARAICARDGVQALGVVDDLDAIYASVRAFVAPVRFAAGIPLKIFEAAAQGVPVVASTVLVDQLGWEDGRDLFAAANAAEFAGRCAELLQDEAGWHSMRDHALTRIRQDASVDAFAEKTRRIVESVLSTSVEETGSAVASPSFGSSIAALRSPDAHEADDAAPFVSVCVPVFNGAEFLDACLASIEAQTYRDFEVIVVDDCSSDESFAIASRFASRDPRIRLVRNATNLGLAANWNRAIGLARGRWVKFVFQDDLIRPACLERMVAQVGEATSLIACARGLLFEPEVSESVRDWYRQHAALMATIHPRTVTLKPADVRRLIYTHLRVNLFGEPTSILIRRDVFERFGHFRTDLVMACDLEYWNRVATNDGAVFLAETLADFRVHETATSAANRNQLQFRSGPLDDLLVLKAYATEPVYRALREDAVKQIPPLSLPALLRQRKHELHAMASWSAQPGWTGPGGLGDALAAFYEKFPDMKPTGPSHLLWRLRLRLKSLIAPHGGTPDPVRQRT